MKLWQGSKARSDAMTRQKAHPPAQLRVIEGNLLLSRSPWVILGVLRPVSKYARTVLTFESSISRKIGR